MTDRTTDLRHARRVATAICVVTAPALVGVVRGFYPAFTASKAATVVAEYRHHLGGARVELAACLLAGLVLPFFVLGLYRLTCRRAPALAGVGAVMALLGWIAIPFLGAQDALAYELARHGGSPAIYDHFANHDAYIALGTTIFLIGHEIGTVVLGAALWRTRTVPKWAATAVVVAPVAHLVAATGGIRWLDVVAFTILTIGAASAAHSIVTTADDQWDLAAINGIDEEIGTGNPSVGLAR